MATAGSISIFNATGTQASLASATVTVPTGYKILCGGAQVSENGMGNMLTSSYPTSIYSWRATSKDQTVVDAEQITVYAVAIYDPNDAYDVQIFSATSPEPAVHHPSISVNVASNYTLTGGGAQASYTLQGQFLTASCPNGTGSGVTGWQASSADHLTTDLGTVTAYAIGIRPLGSTGAVTNTVATEQSGTASHTSTDVSVPANYVLVGGGASVTQGVKGNLLTASYPTSATEWQGNSQDQQVADPEVLTAFVIGAQFAG